jgi:hypothetical protein
MKVGIHCLLASFCLGVFAAHSQTNIATNTIFLFRGPASGSIEVAPVETAETKEQHSIKAAAAALIKAGDFDKLDLLAAKYRLSGECFADGAWKLGSFYCGVSLSDTNTDGEWEGRLAALRIWTAGKPESITARVALAGALIDYAWKARGGGWGDSVTEEGWRLFGQRLHQAQTVLSQALELKDSCPVYWSYQMNVARGLSYDKELFKVIFKQATNAYPGYSTYQLHRAIYLLPRWGGEAGEWEDELTKAADQLGGDAGDMLYAQTVWRIHACVGMKNIFEENQLSWARVDRGFAVIEKKYPDSLFARNERAHLAVLAHDKTNARKYFDETGGKIDLTSWYSSNNYIRMAMWAYAQ